MKKRFLLPMFIIPILISLSAKNDKPVFADEPNPNLPVLTDEEIVENLENLKSIYQNMYENEDESEHSITIAKINVLDELCDLHREEGISVHPPISSDSIDFSYYGAPNCECTLFNLIAGEPCYYCRRFVAVKLEIGAILAAFTSREWYLAADLLSFNVANTELDCVYTPSIELSNVLLQSEAINQILLNNQISESYLYNSPGLLNGVFMNTAEGDSYNSLGSFYYTKNAIDPNRVSLSIHDRYDWNATDRYGISNVLISEMEYAENIGILTPFYTRINFETDGVAICKWEYSDNGATVNKCFGGFSQICLPDTVYDFRSLVANPPEVPFVKIEDEAFKDCTSLEKLSLPKGLQEIGDDVFLNCPSLTTIEISNSVNQVIDINLNCFDGCNSLFEIAVPLQIISLYTSDTIWGYYSSRFVPNLGDSHDEFTLNQSLSFNDYVNQIEKPYKVYVINSASIFHYNFEIRNDENKQIKFSLYDSSYSLIASYTGSNINFVKTISIGTYYGTIQFLDNYTERDEIRLSISPTDHVYSLYTWINYSTHKSLCSCGRSRTDGHVVSQSSLGHGRYSICLLCHGSAEVAFVGPLSVNVLSLLMSENGSYILPNGVIVLVDDDIELYMDGALEFFISDPSLENI